jgi:hypothetical protein
MRKVRISGGLVVLLTVLCFLPSSGWGQLSLSCTCSGTPGELQSCLYPSSPGTPVSPETIVTVTGNCTDNLSVTTDGITLVAATSPTLGGTQITAADPTKPVIKVSARNVTINGFTIQDGTIGIKVSDLASANIVYNMIKNNTTAGILVRDGSEAHIGFINDSDASASSNTITGNPLGILVSATSSASIVGNTINSSGVTTAICNGIQVEKVSQADIAGNTIDGFLNGIAVSGNSGVNLADGSVSPFDSFNNTDPGNKNSVAAIACTTGGYVGGYLGSLVGAKATSFDATCINALESPPNKQTLVGVWTVVSYSGNFNKQPTQLTFNANGTGTTSFSGNTTEPLKWTLTGSQLSISSTQGHIMHGTLTWSDVNDVTYVATSNDPSMSGTLTLTLQRVTQ